MYPTFIVCNVDCGIDIGSRELIDLFIRWQIQCCFERWPSIHLHQDDNSVETIDTLAARISTKSFPRLIDVILLQVDCTGGII
jgi:hypothetical protein